MTAFVFEMVQNKESFYHESVYLFLGIDVIYELTWTLDKIDGYFEDSEEDEKSV